MTRFASPEVTGLRDLASCGKLQHMSAAPGGPAVRSRSPARMFLFLLLPLCVTLCCGHYDNEDWTDPTDMFNYDAATGKMIKLKPNAEENVEAVCEKDACPDINSNALVLGAKKPKSETEELKHKEDLKSPDSNSNPVFRRYLRKMLTEAERFGLPEDSSSEVYYNAEMVLSKQMVAEIKKFIADEDYNLGALEDAVIRTLVQFRSHNVKAWWTGVFEDHLGIDLGTISKILLCMACVISIIATEWWSRIGWFTQIQRLCILSFIVSIAWNWMYLYKVAFAERQAEMAKLQKFDGSCGEKMSWSDSLLEWLKGASTFQNDPCEEYFKALMINPALMVPPTKALALTFTDFITEPLKHVGKALGEFLKGLLSEIPVFYQLLVLIFIALIFMVSCYGASTTFGQVLLHRNNRDAPPERLPPAAPPRLHYGNATGDWQQQPYYLEPEYAPAYRYRRIHRPENLHAMDGPDGGKNEHLPGLTLGDAGQEIRKEELTKQSRTTTTEQKEVSHVGNPQEKEQLKERSHGAQQEEHKPAVEGSIGLLQRGGGPIEQKLSTKYQRNHDAIQEINGTPENEQIEVESVGMKGKQESKEEPLHTQTSSQQHRRENSVEEGSHETSPDGKCI